MENENNENVEQNQQPTEQNQPSVEQTNTEQQNASDNTTVNNGAQGDIPIVNWLKSNTKLVAIAIAVIIVAIVAVVLILSLSGSPEKAVKKYVAAFSSLNTDKFISSMDIKGAIAYSECYSYLDGFDEEEFEDEYDDVKKSDIKDKEKSIRESFDSIKSNMEDNKFSLKIVRFEEVEESDECDGLYFVDAKIRVEFKDDDGDKQDMSKSARFIVYKNKIIYADIQGLL